MAHVQKKRRRKTRLRSDDAFKYLKARSAQETALRKEELQLQREKRELNEQKIQLEQATFDQVKKKMQQQQQQILIQQQIQADYQKQQLKVQEQLLQRQIHYIKHFRRKILKQNKITLKRKIVISLIKQYVLCTMILRMSIREFSLFPSFYIL